MIFLGYAWCQSLFVQFGHSGHVTTCVFYVKMLLVSCLSSVLCRVVPDFAFGKSGIWQFFGNPAKSICGHISSWISWILADVSAAAIHSVNYG